MEASCVEKHAVVSRVDWLVARKELLAKEKKFTRARDKLSQQRRDLPWVRVDKDYVFTGPKGRVTLKELFAGRHQLIVYHFMFTPGWDEGCPHCSFWADNFNDVIVHLNHRDASFVAISRARFDVLDAFKKRLGWGFTWVSSGDTEFNYDFGASFRPDDLAKGEALYNFGTQEPGMSDREGVSVFYQDDDGGVFHTYSAYSRGIDMLNTAYHYLDLAPKGRDEKGLPGAQDWVRYHDKYDN
jgi:predicted dithiol-disulfide oxidoreductase (DUF899 family)